MAEVENSPIGHVLARYRLVLELLTSELPPQVRARREPDRRHAQDHQCPGDRREHSLVLARAPLFLEKEPDERARQEATDVGGVVDEDVGAPGREREDGGVQSKAQEQRLPLPDPGAQTRTR